MKLISSRENTIFKNIKHLATSSQARRKEGLTLLDGVHVCQMYLAHIGQPTWCVVSESAQVHVEIAPILQQLKEEKTQTIILADNLYQQVSQVEQGVGIFFVVSVPESNLAFKPTSNFLADQSANKLNQTTVMLDRVQDPGNVGSILRSAAAAGIKQVICNDGTVSVWSPKVVRAAMGAHFLLDIVEHVALEDYLQNCPIPVLATSSYASQTIYSANLASPVIWLFGHEGQGVSDDLMQHATLKVSVPHQGQIESLNVAACAAICFFEQVRQQLIS